MVSRIDVKRFKSIEGLALDLENINVLIGANNSGKSSAIQALHFMTALCQSRKLISSPKFGFTIAPQQILYTPLADVISLSPKGNLTQDKQREIAVEIHADNGQTASVGVRRGKNRNLNVQLLGDAELLGQIEDVTKPFSIYVPGLAGISKTEHLISPGLLTRAVARGDANLVLRNVLLQLNKDPTKWAAFSSALGEVFPGCEIEIKFEEATDEFINAEINYSDVSLPLDAAGTGLLQTTQILSYFFLFAPKLALLDEPDSHLHPNNQRSLANLLVKLAEPGTTQFIVATHSRHMLDVLADRAKVIWLKAGALVENTKHIEILLDLGALDSAEGLLSNTIEYVLLTEDELKEPVTAVAHAIVPAQKLQIWSYKGCTNTQTAAALGSFIREVSPNTRVVAHRDSDYLQQDQMTLMAEEYAADGIEVFFTPGVDIESLFCRLPHLQAVNPGDEAFVAEAHAAAQTGALLDLRKATVAGALNNYSLRTKKKMAVDSEASIRQWAEQQDLTVERWTKGKVLLPKIRKAFQDLTGRNLKVFAPSETIAACDLKQKFGVLPDEPTAGVAGQNDLILLSSSDESSQNIID